MRSPIVFPHTLGPRAYRAIHRDVGAGARFRRFVTSDDAESITITILEYMQCGPAAQQWVSRSRLGGARPDERDRYESNDSTRRGRVSDSKTTE